MQVKKSKIVMIFSIIIIVFGVAGCAISSAGIAVVRSLNIGSEDSPFMSTVNGTLSTATSTIGNSSLALKNIAVTIEASKVSLSTASDMLINSSEALEEISDIMNFEIIGTKPLAGTSQYFVTIADDLEKLSGNIDSLSQSIGTNINDINRLSDNLGEISITLGNFSTSLSETTGTDLGFGIKSFLYATLIVMVALNIMFILIGSSLLIVNK
jgi:hypothetical protein